MRRSSFIASTTGGAALGVASLRRLAFGAPEPAPSTYRVGSFLVDVSRAIVRVRHQSDADRSLWETAPGQPLLQAAVGKADIKEYGNPLGLFHVRDNVSSLSTFSGFDSVQSRGDKTLQLRGALEGPATAVSSLLTLDAVSENQLRFSVALEGGTAKRFNRLYLRYASSASEAYFGFGGQLTHVNQKGRVIPILVQEHGVGRGLPVVSQAIDLKYDGAAGNDHLTELPAPQYITSQLRSLFLENKEYSSFDMRAANFTEIALFSGAMTGRILFGRSPLDLIGEYTTFSGRMRAMPDWSHEGVVIGVQGGTARARALLSTLLAAKVPIAAFWIQDWCGQITTPAGKQLMWNWQLNEEHYPGWDELVAQLAQQGARMLIYINPFLAPGPLHSEAAAKGYLVRRGGATFVYKNSSILAGMLDLSNPATRAWIKSVIRREMIEKARASGWMGDFGEALPFDAQLFEGADPAVWHNHYPEAWSGVHREAIDETGRGDEFVFWNRSGFSQSPAVSTSFWLGDQLQTWDDYDGIKTAVVGLLSGGISGFSLMHSDTGGFVAAEIAKVPIIARSPELLMRWMELNAFTTMLRTHEGLIPSISAQVDTNAETLAHLARFGRVFKALAPYRKRLVREANLKGYPVARHLFLHYPSDPNVITLRYQFMLGADFVVAPVLDKGRDLVRLYLPAGDWTHLWSGRDFPGTAGRWVAVAAPLGQPGIFFKTGAASGTNLVAALKASGDL
jgi:alpha-glucosidase